MFHFDPNFKTTKKHFNHGFSVIEVLIATGILSIVSLGIAEVLTTSNRSVAAIQQKMEAIELQQSIVRLTQDPNICSCAFINQTISTTTPQTTLAGLKSGCGSTATDLVVTGQPINTGSSLHVSSVKLINVQSVSATQMTGQINISFDSSKLVRPIKDITMAPLLFTVSAGALACQGIQNADVMCVALGGVWNGTTCSQALATPTQTCQNLGGTMTGTTCTLPPPAPSTECTTLGGIWSAATSSCTLPPQSPSASCTALGGVWSGTSCHQPALDTCTSLGGLLTGTTCVFPPPAPNTSCTSLGGTWNGTNCIQPAAATCTSLGGTMDASGVCSVAAASSSTPPAAPTTTPPPAVASGTMGGWCVTSTYGAGSAYSIVYPAVSAKSGWKTTCGCDSGWTRIMISDTTIAAGTKGTANITTNTCLKQ